MGILARGIVLINFIVMFLLIPTVGVSAKQKKTPVTHDQVARKKIAELESQLRAQSAQLDSLKTEMSANLKKQETHVRELDKSAEDQNKEIEGLKKQNTYNSELSSEGAIILLVGLLVEILGALLLGAPVLANKIEELSDFEIDPGLDMALHAPKKEAVLAFYSMIGNILLFFGFTAQFTGTALVLNVGWMNQLLVVFGGLIFGLIVLIWLLGIDPSQSRRQKILVVWKNIVRVSKLRISSLCLKGRECEICLKRVEKNQSHIFWYDQGNIPSHPYLHTPHEFTVGHKDCMDIKMAEKIASQANYENREKIKSHLYVMKGQDFIANRLDDYKKWFVGHYDEWSKRRADTPKPSKQEIALDVAVKKIKKIET